MSAKIFFSYYYIIFLMSHFKSSSILFMIFYYAKVSLFDIKTFILPQVFRVSRHPFRSFLREELVLSTSACKTTRNPRWIRSREPFRILVCLRRSFDRVRWFSAELNMCTLLSLRWNNTRYLARDKCLSRRILESTEAVAELRIFPEAGVSPHKGSKGCPFFPPPCLSEAW